MIALAPDNQSRPVLLTTEINMTTAPGQPRATAALLNGAGTLISARIKACSPVASIAFFDSATAATTGAPLQISDSAATPLAASVTYEYGRPFADGLSVAVNGAVDALVTYTASQRIKL